MAIENLPPDVATDVERPGCIGSFEQPGVVGGVPAYGSWVATGWALRFLPTQTIL